MFDIDDILHPTDFSPGAHAAFRYALQLASRRGATLHLLHEISSLGDDPVRGAFEAGIDEESFYQQAEAKADASMQVLLKEARESDVVVKQICTRGIAPGPVIVEYAEDNDVDLIVMGTHGRRGVRRFVLGSVAEEVVRKAPCSVLTVRGEPETEPSDVRRVLVPVDLSEFTEPLLRTAKEVAASFGARIDLLHVVEPLPFPVPLVGAVTIHDLIPDPSERSREQLEQLKEGIGGPPVDVELRVEEGHAAMTILETAEELGSNLIVIASHGLSGLERVLLGSVTARVVRRAACPVLVVRVVPKTAAPETEGAEKTTQRSARG